jgi:hypothetical protein
MKYQVPQFIEVEDKIFGPLTFKQFVYLAGGAGFAFIMYRIFPLYIAIFLILPGVGFALALAFYKINKKPFIEIVESAFKYAFASKLYIWKKETKKIEKKEVASSPSLIVPKLSDSKLEDLSWSLDIKEDLNNEEDDEK